ncbi:MAG: histidine kinase [Christensenellaceae bacterium]
MIEIIDNAIQLFITTSCAIWVGTLAAKRKSQSYFILACFYGTFALGLLFWLSYLAIMTYTPKIFYVSDLSWFASFLFLLLLDITLATPDERNYKPIFACVIAAIPTVTTICFLFGGDVFGTLLWCPLLIACTYNSTRGFLYARKQTDVGRNRQWIHLAILFFIFTEFTLWTLSNFFKSTTIENPYFWCDFVLSAALFLLMPAMKKAVDA